MSTLSAIATIAALSLAPPAQGGRSAWTGLGINPDAFCETVRDFGTPVDTCGARGLFNDGAAPTPAPDIPSTAGTTSSTSSALPAYCDAPGASSHALPLPEGFAPLDDPALGFNVIPDPTRPEQHQMFLDAIKGATSSIQLAMFHLVDVNVVTALCAAAKRLPAGRVQVLLDRSSLGVSDDDAPDAPVFDRSNEYNEAFKRLKGCGVAVTPSSAAFSITHEKAMTADYDLPDGAPSKIALITSSNLVKPASALKMADFEASTRDPGVIAEHHLVFETDLTNARLATGVTPPLSNPHLLWSPERPKSAVTDNDGNGNSEERLAALINSAARTLDLTVENFTSACIQSALANAMARGVRVRMLVPECVLDSTSPTNFAAVTAVNSLSRTGPVVRVMPGSGTAAVPYMHAKTILADERTFYVGSENYSANSLGSAAPPKPVARECGLISNNAAAAQMLKAAFERFFDASIAPPARPGDWGCSE